ncbi:MAG: hypothetical protein FWC47_02815 [Oscillospiraceae bacterium]|nr:hypothetical protein [Oscillospiraceae bacterium]
MNKDDFIKYLNDDSITTPYLINVKTSGYAKLCFKYQATDDIVAFYSLEKYNRYIEDNQIICFDINGPIQYGGFYSRCTGKLYDVDYRFQTILGIDNSSVQKIDQLRENLAQNVAQRISDIIHSDPSIVKGFISEKQLNDLPYYASSKARDAFFEGKTIKEIVYVPFIDSKLFNQNDIFSYVKNPNECVDELSTLYLGSADKINHDKLKSGLALEKLTCEKLQEISNDVEHIYHKQRDIAYAIKESGAKTVKITIDKYGKEFTFSTEAAQLQWTGANYYSAYAIKSQDREEFYKIYGRNEDYNAGDVVSITYNKKEIYNREKNNGTHNIDTHVFDKEREGASFDGEIDNARFASSEFADNSEPTHEIHEKIL